MVNTPCVGKLKCLLQNAVYVYFRIISYSRLDPQSKL